VNNPNTVSTVSRKFAVISVIILLLIVAVGGVFLYYALDASSASPSSPKHLNFGTVFNLKNDVNLALNVTVIDPSGKVIASVYQPHDLITNNFYYLMLYPFLLSGYPSSWDVVNTAGTSVSVCYSGCTTTLAQSSGIPPLLAIGSGTTAPAVTDYKLTTLVTNMPTVATTQTYYGSNSITLTVSSTAVLTTATTISEAGYEVELNNGNYALIAHDTFTGVSVPAGGAITIAYQWTFGDSSQVWMANYMNWMASVVGAYTTCQGTSFNTCGNPYGYAMVTSTSNGVGTIQPYTISYENPFICVGTGTTAPAWTQDNLISQVSCVQTSSPSYSAGSNTVYVSASISIPSSSTITEVGLKFYAYMTNTGYLYYLMFRSTFSGIVVSAGQSVTITIGYQV
jgi:hypothetical protein